MRDDDAVHISSLGGASLTGAAPVQATGTVAGHPFYFRARHDHWSFALSEDPSVDPVDIRTEEAGDRYGFFRESRVGTEPFAASYLPAAEAAALIRQCAAEYLAPTREHVERAQRLRTQIPGWTVVLSGVGLLSMVALMSSGSPELGIAALWLTTPFDYYSLRSSPLDGSSRFRVGMGLALVVMLTFLVFAKLAGLMPG